MTTWVTIKLLFWVLGLDVTSECEFPCECWVTVSACVLLFFCRFTIQGFLCGRDRKAVFHIIWCWGGCCTGPNFIIIIADYNHWGFFATAAFCALRTVIKVMMYIGCCWHCFHNWGTTCSMFTALPEIQEATTSRRYLLNLDGVWRNMGGKDFVVWLCAVEMCWKNSRLWQAMAAATITTTPQILEHVCNG